MDEAASHLILHVSENPADTQILQSQLESEIEGAHLTRAVDLAEIQAHLDGGRFGLMVVDLPLTDVRLDTAVANLQVEHPDLNVLFRWSAGGTWQHAGSEEPLAGIVRQTLHVEAPRKRPPGDGKRMLDRLVRGQEVLLRLAKTDFWDFQEALEKTTESLGRLLGVERVSVWEFDGEHRKLSCLDLFELSPQRHSIPTQLTDFPRYVEALGSSLIVAANDARADSRTSEFRDQYLVPLGITSMLDAPIRSRGVVRGVVCLEHVGPMRVWDVLEQCHASSAANLLAHAIELRDRRRLEERLREADHLSSIGRLAARLAHDFNNRLAVIQSEIELALGASEPHRAAREAISGQVAKARAIARNLMSLNRQRAVPPPPADLTRLTLDLRPALERLVGPRITFEMTSHGGPLPVAIVPADFEQVLLNLVTNARDAMPRGGALQLTLGPLDGEPGETRRVRLVVEDNGCGMDAETRSRMFEPFFSTTDGAGFGLPSVFAVVNEAGGTIEVETHVDEGTRLTIDLPRAG